VHDDADGEAGAENEEKNMQNDPWTAKQSAPIIARSFLEHKYF
jgi:hypothetical protein